MHLPGDRMRYSDFDKDRLVKISASLKNPYCLYFVSGNSSYLTGGTYGEVSKYREKSAAFMLVQLRMTKAGWLTGWK